MEYILYSLLGIGIVVLVRWPVFPLDCPRCESRLPVFRLPDSFNQMLFGGWTCKKCGCKINRTGREIKNV